MKDARESKGIVGVCIFKHGIEPIQRLSLGHFPILGEGKCANFSGKVAHKSVLGFGILRQKPKHSWRKRRVFLRKFHGFGLIVLLGQNSAQN
jgi:hypothetical protein